MRNQRCEGCEKIFKWKEVQRSIFPYWNKPLICSECGTKHFIKGKMKTYAGLSTGIIAFIAMSLPIIEGLVFIVIAYLTLILYFLILQNLALKKIDNDLVSQKET